MSASVDIAPAFVYGRRAVPSASSYLPLAIMDAVELGLIACLADGCLIQANRAARREIGASGPLRIEQGRLVCNGFGQSALEAAFRDAGRGIRHLLWIGGKDHRLMVATQPLPGEAEEELAVLLVLGRRSACSSLSLEMMAMRHGLTLAEKRVLCGLIDLRDPRQIAADNGVQLSTVRTQIQSLRSKLDVRSVDELLLRVAQLPAVASCVG